MACISTGKPSDISFEADKDGILVATVGTKKFRDDTGYLAMQLAMARLLQKDDRNRKTGTVKIDAEDKALLMFIGDRAAHLSRLLGQAKLGNTQKYAEKMTTFARKAALEGTFDSSALRDAFDKTNPYREGQHITVDEVGGRSDIRLIDIEGIPSPAISKGGGGGCNSQVAKLTLPGGTPSYQAAPPALPQFQAK